MQVSELISKMNLGVSKQVLQGTTDSPMHTLLIGLHQEIIEQLTASIDKYDIKASNHLKQSIVTVDESKTGTLIVAVSVGDAFYWKYINYGVNGTKVNRGAPTWGSSPAGTISFKDSILGWIKDKGIVAAPGQTYDQLAFSIMKGIKEKGQEARPFYSDVVNKELKDYLTKSISAVIKQAINIEIKDPWQ